ncbi:peptidase U32 family protein [Howardella ureilytica]
MEHGKRLKPEVLAPAGNLDILKIAITYGADAVYIGGEVYGLRAAAHNFTNEEIKEGIKYAHERGKKVYITANILAHNEDLEGVREYFKELDVIKPDAVIISDPGVFMIAKELLHDIELHVSTQANNINYGTYNFWHLLGASRVVTGRELSLEEIREIRKNIPDDLEIETFVHGAMCMSYSGRCLLSNYMTDRDANRGECTHPCRWRYSLVEENRPGEYLPVFENERGTFIFNSKDLCMIDYIPELVNAGIDSFKIEGRMKTALYVATTVRAYRMAIDDWFEDEKKYKERLPFYNREVNSASRRKYTTGFFFNKADETSMFYESERSAPDTYLGTVERIDDKGMAVLEQKNKFSVGDVLEVIKPNGENIPITVLSITDDEGNGMESCPHPKQILHVEFDRELSESDILRNHISR